MNAMNNIKKSLSLLLVFVLAFTLFPMPAQAADTCDHNYDADVCAPSCAMYGYTTYTCTECGDSYEDDYQPALEHTYTCKQINNVLIYTCVVCGNSYSEEVPTATYNRVTKFENGESYVICVYNARKYYALSHAGNRISAVEVSVSNGKVNSQVSNDLLWTYSGGKLSYESNGKTYYLYNSSTTSGTLTVHNTRTSAISVSSSSVRVGSYYLKYSSGTIKTNRNSANSYAFLETFE